MKRLLPLLVPLLSPAADWRSLPALPDAEGFAGVFAGVSDGAMLVAGGANFPEAPPWRGGTKTWYDSVFALTDPQGEWQRLGRLPRATVVCTGPGSYRVRTPYLPSWALVAAAVTFPLGLMFLLVRSRRDLHVVLVPGSHVLRFSGRVPASTWAQLSRLVAPLADGDLQDAGSAPRVTAV